MGDLQRQALARDLARRLSIASLDVLRVLDRALHRCEQLRTLRWERRIATTPNAEQSIEDLVSIDAELANEDRDRADAREAARLELQGGG